MILKRRQPSIARSPNIKSERNTEPWIAKSVRLRPIIIKVEVGQ